MPSVRVERTVKIDTTDIYLEGDVTRAGFEVVADDPVSQADSVRSSSFPVIVRAG